MRPKQFEPTRLALVVTLLAAMGGGKAGRRYHAKVDRALLPGPRPRCGDTSPHLHLASRYLHRDFCEVAIADGGRTKSVGRVATDPEQLKLFARSLAADDRVVFEATGNALAIARLVFAQRTAGPTRSQRGNRLTSPKARRGLFAGRGRGGARHAKQARAIGHARVTTASTLAAVTGS